MRSLSRPHFGMSFARVSVALASLTVCASASSQLSTIPSEGIIERPVRHVVLQHARIVSEPGRVIEDGSIEIRDGRIVSVGAGTVAPAGATTRDMAGKTVFAGFVDAAVQLGLPEDMRPGGIKPLTQPGQPPHVQTLDQPGPRHWSRRVRPELSVADRLDYRAEEAKPLRALGFAAVQSVPEAGIIKGRSAVLSLRDTSREKDVLLSPDAAQIFGFDFPAGFAIEYPGSLMGAIALIRQSLIDARWQTDSRPSKDQRFEANLALEALSPSARGRQLSIFALDDELDVRRVSKLVQEFSLRAAFIGSGYEYRVLDQARAARVPFIVPLVFPEAPKIERAESMLDASLADLQHWEQAPANPARLVATGIDIALTTRGLKKADKEFWPNLRRAVRAGLTEDAALRALTVTPAALLGQSEKLGRIAPGKYANFVVADEGLFRDDKAALYETWVEGERFEFKPVMAVVVAGTWAMTWADGRGPTSLAITGEDAALVAKAGDIEFKIKLAGEELVALPPASLFKVPEGRARISARVTGDSMEGYRDLVDGRRVRFSGRRTEPAKLADAKPPAVETPDPIPMFRGYPAGEYGRVALPPAPAVLLIRGATVWTNADDGILKATDVLVRKGKISAVGVGLAVPSDAQIVEANGRHLTSGIIDAHSHTAIARNVNEPSHAVTTEVRVADVLDPTDIDIYRQLAGGVTVANLLHGSANPMGGQNAVIKLRWGADADGLLFVGAPAGVKFALGENVKQSGWGDGFTTRYPQTRMGVEQLMREEFNAARDYAAQRAGKDGKSVRRDLRLEALAEILAGDRLIHIHSYRQDEILMFARLAKEYDLPVATFQHVLEGYKVADAIADIGAGGSTFADWWGYKMEVIDGIPENGALMTRAGVLTSFNSDSNEMARRLNMEAAKAMRHGGLDEQEALKLVTLNPAIQLHVDDHVGSIAVGKDADLVLWSDHPLSNYARAEQTWIDGRKYFDRDDDRALQAQATSERERLIQRAAKERAKSFDVADAAKPEENASGGAPDPALVRELSSNRNWQIEHAAGRSLYHSGADLMSCGLQDHAH